MQAITLIFLILSDIASTAPVQLIEPEAVKAWRSLRIMGIGLEMATGSLGENYYNGTGYNWEYVRLGTGLAYPWNFGLWLKLWQGELTGSETISVRLSYTPYQIWGIWDGKTRKRARIDLFAEGGTSSYHLSSWFSKIGLSGSFNFFPEIIPVDAEIGWGYHGGNRLYAQSGFFINISSAVYEMESPIHHPDSFTKQGIKDKDGPKAWLGYTAFGYSLIFPQRGFASLENDMLTIGAGFTPPIGIGVWLKILPIYQWQTYGSGDMAALRLTYTPYMSWNTYKYGLYRTSRVDLFVESSYSSLSSELLFRAGLAGTFSLFPRIVPFTAEVGWVYSRYDYGPISPDYNGPYCMISASALGIDVPLGGSPVDLKESIVSPFKDVRPWLSYEVLSAGLGIFDRHIPVIPQRDLILPYEVTFLKAGAGFTPPMGIGIWGRVWIGEASWDRPAVALRLAYSPFTTYKKEGNITYRRTRTDIFAEIGTGRSDLCFRSGVSASYTWKPSFVTFSIEGGWLYYEQWDYARQGAYAMITIGLLGGEFEF